MNTNKSATCLMLLVALALTACASQPKTLAPIPHDAELKVVVEPVDELPQPSATDGSTSAANVLGGTAAGAGAGAASGALAGLGCGPWAVICSPAGAIAGAMGGGLFGLGFGSYRAVQLALPAEKAHALDAVIAATYTAANFETLLQQEFHAQSHWSLNDDAPVEVALSLDQIALEKQYDDFIVVTVVTSVRVIDTSGAKKRVRERSFPISSSARHVDEWIEDDGAGFRLAIRDGISRSVFYMTQEMRGY